MRQRALIMSGIIAWYIGMRSLIFYYFLGGGTSKDMYFFEWWWSWLEALPATALSLAIFVGLPLWVIKGSWL